MSAKKLTPWFPGDVKPARKGVYERQYGGAEHLGYARWDGRQWFVRWQSIYYAQITSAASIAQSLPWRGLAKEPA